MKPIRLALVTAALLAGSVTVASAQGGPPAGQPGRGNMMARQVQGLFKDITLSEAQTAKRDSVVTYYTAEMAKLPPMSRDNPGTEEDRAKRTELQNKMRADFRAILTDEAAQKQFDKNVEEMAAARRGGGGGGRPPAGR